MNAVALAIAAAAAIAVLLTLAVWLATRNPGRHAAPRPPRRRPRPALLRLLFHTPRWFPPRLWLYAALAKVKGLRRDELSDEDRETELWVDGLKTPALRLPVRRPGLLTNTRMQVAAIIRVLPLDAFLGLQKSHRYKDATGSFEALTADPPALHAHESIAMTQAAMAEGLAEQQAKEWGP